MTDTTTTEATPVEGTEVHDEPQPDVADTPAADADVSQDQDDSDDEADTFPREVVEKLRQENGKYRQRAQRAEDLAHRLHTELVRATGRLADPTDLEYVDEHLDDPDAMTAAIDDLLDRKPHLATRRPSGDIGQGQRGAAPQPFSLLGLLKERT